MDNTVFFVKCRHYEEVENKLTELLAMMNGMGSFVKPGEKIVLKVNLLQSAKPAKAVTTHPAVVAAAARLVKKEGAIPIITDSPGSGYAYNKKNLEKTYRVCGLDTVAEEDGIELNLDPSYDTVSFPGGKLIKLFEVITPVLEADGLLNLCKLKTHDFIHMTGAV